MFKSTISRIKNFITTHERKLSAAAIVTGFIWDSITLTRIDYLFEVVVLGAHMVLITLWIVLINVYDAGVIRGATLSFFRRLAPILMQFSFGALFSGLTIFYIKSASITTSLLFVLLLILLLIGNEFFRYRYQKLIFQLSILYVALAAFWALYLPVLVKAVGAWVFIGALFIALLILILIVRFIRLFVPSRIQKARRFLAISVGGIFIFLNVLYFTNIIPPVPLALKESGVYHTISRSGDVYTALTQEQSFFERFLPRSAIEIAQGESVAVFTAVFAPTDLETRIMHEWQYKNDEGAWVTTSRIPFSITGGREGGFRGYTVKNNVFAGVWRVNVLTTRNQVLGRVGFTVTEVVDPAPRIQETL